MLSFLGLQPPSSALCYHICGFYSCGRGALATDDMYQCIHLYNISDSVLISIFKCLDRASRVLDFRNGFWLSVLITP